MQLTITIETGNDAFFENENQEIARILRGYADRIEEGSVRDLDRTLADLNGNKVGKAVYANE